MSQPTFIPDDARPDLSGRRRVRRYHAWRKVVELRPENKGKAITDAAPTLQIDAETLDLASEFHEV